MIAETSLLGGSPWQTDVALQSAKDLLRLSSDNDLCYDWESHDSDRIYAQQGNIEMFLNKSLESIATAIGLPEQESESNDICVKLDDETVPDVDPMVAKLHQKEFVPSPLPDILSEENEMEPVPLVTFDWMEEDMIITESAKLSNHSEYQTNGEPNNFTAISKEPYINALGLEDTSWTSMTYGKKLNTIERISQVISEELGLREQLEVIRIINPTADISPTDTEFVIELGCMNDDKIQQIVELIDNIKQGEKCKPETSRSPDTCSLLSPKKHSKGVSSQDRRIQQRVIRQRQQKERRQALKEQKSGLFDHEEVLALSQCNPGDEDDIDIC